MMRITVQHLLVLVQAWPKLMSTSNHTYFFVKTLQTHSSCFQNNGDTNFLPWPCLSHIPATSRLYLQREWEAVSQEVRKSWKVSLLLESAARTPLGKEKFWSWKVADNAALTASSWSGFFLSSARTFTAFFFSFPPLSPPVFFSVRGLVAPFHPTHLQLHSQAGPACGYLLNRSCPDPRPQARWPLSSLLPLTRRFANPPTLFQRCQLLSQSEEQEGCHRIRAGRMLFGRFCSNNCSFLSLFFFCLLPCSGTGSSLSLPARCLTAPACGNRGNYSKRSRKTDTHDQPGHLLALICPLHTHSNSCLLCIYLYVCESVRGTRHKAWLRPFLYNMVCPTRAKQSS